MLRQGQTVYIHYAGNLDDGTTFVNTWLAQQPVQITIGENDLLPAFENEIVSMTRGQRRTFRVDAADAYGLYDPNAIIEFPCASIPDAHGLPVGQYVEFETRQGRIRVKVLGIDSETVRFDCNHELAGQALNFEVELVEDGSADLVEQEMSAHGCGCGKLRESLSNEHHHHGEDCC